MGEAIPGVEMRIAEDGEVLARGPNRFVGYWQNPEATAAAIDAEGWYHAGDLGELSADGYLTLRGRKKDMIALPDGQKVYPDDVEAVLDRGRSDPRLGGGRSRRRRDRRACARRPASRRCRRRPRRWCATRTRAWPGTSRSATGRVWPEEDFPRTPS